MEFFRIIKKISALLKFSKSCKKIKSVSDIFVRNQEIFTENQKIFLNSRKVFDINQKIFIENQKSFRDQLSVQKKSGKSENAGESETVVGQKHLAGRHLHLWHSLHLPGRHSSMSVYLPIIEIDIQHYIHKKQTTVRQEVIDIKVTDDQTKDRLKDVQIVK